MTDKEKQIRERAYGIWEAEGYPQGRADDHWHRAALEIEAAMPAQAELMLNPAARSMPEPAKAEPKAPTKAAAPRRRKAVAETPPPKKRATKKT